MLLAIQTFDSFAQGSLDQRISELSQQISKEMTDNNKKTIAIIEFSDLDGNVTNLGKYISEELITKLYLTKKFKVIERQLLNKIIAEQRLSLTGMIDPNSAKKLGKVLGVDAIVSGTLTDLAQSLKVNARMLNTETGEIFAVASVEIFKDESVTKLMSEVNTTKSKLALSNPSSTESPSTTNKKSDLSMESVKAEGFVFTPQSCKIRIDNLDCVILIENISDAEKTIFFRLNGQSPPCYVYDNMGNQYLAAIQIGPNVSDWWLYSQQFVPNVPVAVHFLAKNFNSQAKSVTVVISVNEFKKTVTIPKILITQ